MKAYKMTGYAPDFFEQCSCTVADIYTNKQNALNEVDKLKSRIIEELQTSCATEEAMKHLCVDEHRYYGNTRFIASFDINVYADPKKKEHKSMFLSFSGLGYSNLTASDITIDSKNLTYRIASIQLTEEDIDL